MIRGESDQQIANLFGLSKDSVFRHRERHLKRELKGALAVRGRSWTQRVDKLARLLERQVDRLSGKEDLDGFKACAQTAGILRQTLRDLGEAAGEFPKADLNVIIAQQIGGPIDRAKAGMELLNSAESMDERTLARRSAERVRAYCQRHGIEGLVIPEL